MLYWENEFGFSILIDFHKPDCWEIVGFHFDLLKPQNVEQRLRNYTRCMRWMIHFPIFSMLECFQKKRLVHACAVSKDEKAIVLAGLNKVGKSSLGHYIYAHFGFNYLSDNFLLTDGKFVYAFPEKERLSPDSVRKLKIHDASEQLVYGKHHIAVDTQRIEVQATAEAVFIVGNNQEGAIESISRGEALGLLESLHRYLQEFPEFTFYSLLDSFEWWEREPRPLFSEQTRFFRLSMPLDWSIEKTATEVMKCISTT